MHSIRVWANFISTSGELLERIEEDLRRSDLPVLTWYDILLELRRAKTGLTVNQLAQKTLLRQYNLSRTVDRMVACGLLTKQASTSDKRIRMIGITEDGDAMLRSMWQVYRSSIKANFAALLNQDELASLASILERLSGSQAP